MRQSRQDGRVPQTPRGIRRSPGVTVTRPQRNHHKARLEPQACRPAPSQKQEPHSATRTRGWLPCLEAYIQWATGRVSWPESTTKDRNLAYLAGSVDPRTAARQVDRLKPRRPDPQPLSRDRETLQPADRGVNRRMLDLRAYRRLDLLGHVVSAPDRPVVRYEDVHRHEGAPPRGACPHGVELDVLVREAAQDRLDTSPIAQRQRDPSDHRRSAVRAKPPSRRCWPRRAAR